MATTGIGLWLTLDAGQLQQVEYDTQTHGVTITLAPSDRNTSSARLRIEQPAAISGVGAYAPTGSYTKEREAFTVPLSASPTVVALAPK